jgi:tetratricopeptide (TPR) repeat protein
LERLVNGAFVGRAREMQALDLGVEDALGGRPRLYLVAGEPGIGKTRLAYEATVAARQRGMRVVWGRCHEDGDAPAYWPWVQILRTYVQDANPDGLRADLGGAASDVAEIVPALRERLPDLPVPQPLDPERARFRLFDGLTTFFQSASRREPLMLVIDDLHGADKLSLLLLQFLARTIADSRVLLVGTYRDMDISRRHPLFQTLGELARQDLSRRILLRGLERDDIARFVRIASGQEPPPSLVTALRQSTEGNPFFVGEVVRLLATEGRLDAWEEDVPWTFAIPQGVREAVGRRVDHLSEDGAAILTVAAAIGRDLSLSVLEPVAELPRARVLDALEEGVRARVLVRVPATPGAYRFAHALVRDALYEDLTTADRVRLHRRIRDTLAALHRADPEPHLAELARHAFEAASGGDVDQAVDYACRAGDRAIRQLDYAEGVHHYVRALHASEWQKPVDDRRRCEMWLALGDAQEKSGDAPEARQSFLRAAEMARKLGEPELLARAAIGVGRQWAQIGVVDETLVALLEEALAAIGDRNDALRARVLARLARELYWTDACARREALSREAIEVAERTHDVAALAECVHQRRAVCWGPDNVEERLAMANEIVRLAEEGAQRELAVVGRLWRLVDALELGDVPFVVAELEVCVRLAEELRQPPLLHWVGVFRGALMLVLGRFEDAERIAMEAFNVGRRVQFHIAAEAFAIQMVLLRREQGRLHEAEAGARAYVEKFPAVPAWRCALAYVSAEMGHEAEARRQLEQLAAKDFRDLPRDFTWVPALTLLSEVAVTLGDARRAEQLYELLEPFAGRNVVVGFGLVAYGPTSHFLGLLATLLRRWDDAERHFADALAMTGRMGARSFRAQVQRGWARMLVARGAEGDGARAVALLDEALVTLRGLDMGALVARAERDRAAAAALAGVPAVGLEAAPQRGARGEIVALGTRNGRGASRHGGEEIELPCGDESLGPCVFRKEGEYWTIACDGLVLRLKDAKGLHYLANLLRRPGQEVHALDLVSEAAGARTPAAATHGLTRAACANGRTGPLLDPRAKAAYRERLAALREEQEEAERFNDPGRATRAREEIEILTQQLASAVGLGGRDREAASEAERARLTVTKRIKDVLVKIRAGHPTLGHHLMGSVKTGYFCTYTPPPDRPIPWAV